MRCLFSRRAMGFLAFSLMLALVNSTALAEKGGKGKGGNGGGGDDGGGTTNLQPVQYQVVWESESLDGRPVNGVAGMNDLGEAVGTLAAETFNIRAFLWDSTGLQGIDILAADAIPDGWLAYSANGINSAGRVVGEAINPDLGISCPFVYDVNLNPEFQLLPEPSIDGYAINDAGDVIYWNRVPDTGDSLGYVYDYDNGDPLGYQNPNRIIQIPLVGIHTADINASGQVIGTLFEPGDNNGLGAFRYTPGASPEIEMWLATETGIEEATSINDDGWFAGYLDRESFRFDTGLTPLGSDGWNSVFRTQKINNRGDVLVGLLDDDSYLFSDDPDKPEAARGQLLINDLVDATDDKWFGGGSVNIFLRRFSDLNNPNVDTDPEVTGFGQICGSVEFVEEIGKGKNRSTVYWTEAFRLVPVTAP